MTYVLSARERKLLEYLQIDHTTFQIRGELPLGSGVGTLSKLTTEGLLEIGPGRFGDTGYRLSDDGWRCMYGKTHDEIMSGDGTNRVHPFKVWSWPPTPDAIQTPAKPNPRLTTLKPRLSELPPRLSPLKRR